MWAHATCEDEPAATGPGRIPLPQPRLSGTCQGLLGARSPNLLSPLKRGADTKHSRCLSAAELVAQGGPREPRPAATPAVSRREASPGCRCQPSLPGPHQDLGKRVHKKSGNADDSTVATGRAVLSQSGDNLRPQGGLGRGPRVRLEREGPADQVIKKGGKVFKMRIEKKHNVSGG